MITPYYDENGITIYCGNCFEILPELGLRQINLILTDPPYNLVSCEWDKQQIDLDKLWELLKPIGNTNAAYVFTSSQPFTSKLVMSNLSWFKYEWVWEKNNAGNFQLANHHPLKIHENIVVFIREVPNMQFANIMMENMLRLGLRNIDIAKLELSKNGNLTGWVSNKLNGSQLPTESQWGKICELFGIKNEYHQILSTIPQKRFNLELLAVDYTLSNKNKGGKLQHIASERKRIKYKQSKTGYPKTILRFKRETKCHPTQKPIALMEFMVKTYTNENDMVLDPFMGSGTTLLAAKINNRKAIGIEISEDYCKTAVERLTQQSNV